MSSHKPPRHHHHHHHVYVVELSDRVWSESSFRRANPDHRLGKPFVHVGMTGLDPDLRFDRHKAGVQANRFVLQYGVRLLPGLFEVYNPMPLRSFPRDGGRTGHRPARSGLRCLAGVTLGDRRGMGDDVSLTSRDCDRMPFLPASHPAGPPTLQAWCFAFVQRELLLPDADTATLRPLDVAALATHATMRHYLGSLAAVDCWALMLPEAPPGWRRTPLRAAMLALDPILGALAGRAAQVVEWDRSHRFCGVCGTPTVLKPGERARICAACGHTAYPRLSPAMMALVWRPGELLLARSPHYAAGMYSALAGFVEAGESLEDCVHREVAEEVALKVEDLRYYGSQSWPFPHSLMVAFTARWAGGDIVPQPGEIEHAQWFGLDALPAIPPRFSIAGHLIRDTLAAMQDGGPA